MYTAQTLDSTYLGPDQVQVNCRLKVKYRKNLMLVCQMLAKPAQILSYNSLANLQLYDLYMIWLLMCLADAMLAGFVVVVSFFSQVWLLSCLSSSLCKNSNEFYVGFVYSSLLVFWTPTCRAEHFCNNGFFAINDAAE